MTVHLTEDEFRALFAEYPSVRKGAAGEVLCPHCANGLSAENLAYYNDATEAGTERCDIEITCDVCGKVAWRGGSWYPGIVTHDELLDVAQKVMDEALR